MQPNTEPLRGSIDICNENGIAGWAFNPNTTNEPVALEMALVQHNF